ncbi:protein YeeZ [Escherichia coli]|nr:protein YeeZ [Escherichia coli]
MFPNPQMARLLGLEPPQFRNSLDSGKGKIIDGSRICNELGFEYQVSRSAGNAAGGKRSRQQDAACTARGVYETTGWMVLMILDALEKEAVLRRRRPNSIRRRPL